VSALRMREATITAGIWLTYAVGGLGALYVALTWERPNRAGLLVLFGMATAAGLTVSMLPTERIVHSRWREPFFLSWTLLDFGMLIVGTVLDGGTGSPLVMVFFIPVVFSSMSYPLGSVITVGFTSVISYLLVALVAGGSSVAFQVAFAVVLGCTAAMSAWQAQNHKRQHVELANASRTDPLTGCLNRRGFEERAVAEIEALRRRDDRTAAVLVLDIDYFKPINDRYGHAAGDELLCWVARTLKATVRPLDAVGRLGGDEFAILFPEIEPADLSRVEARVATALRERAPASIGVAVFPDDGLTLEQLARRADARLYASRAGRSRDGQTPDADDAEGRTGPPAGSQGGHPDGVFGHTTLESLQDALVDQIDASVIVADMNGVVTGWNMGAEMLYGWSREEAIGRSARELVVPTDAEPAERLVAELRRQGRWDGEIGVRRKDGSTFIAYVRNRLVLDGAGRPSAIVGVAMDISDRVAAEMELVQSRNYAEAVTACMGEGLFTLDLTGRLTYINPAAESMLGWPQGELRGKVMHDVIHQRRGDGTIVAREECPIMRAVTDGEMVRIDDDLFTARSGRGLPVAYTATPFHTRDGAQGCVVIFQDISERKRHEEDHRRDVDTLACINRVEDALAEDRFLLYAQPIIDLGSGEIVQHELLLRMRERDGRIAPPGEYLHVAEQYALIGDIDWWVIKRAAQIAGAGCPVELNISARSVGDLDVLEHIERSIRLAQVPPGTLVFEITETAILEDTGAAYRFAERLHALGCPIALDDFGTGYGGLTYLKQMPVDYLKIDIEFVRDIAINSASRHVVQAVVALARDFDLKTVAEGVEDVAGLRALRELGVDFAQGYQIAHPEPFDDRPGDRVKGRRPRERSPRHLVPVRRTLPRKTAELLKRTAG